MNDAQIINEIIKKIDIMANVSGKFLDASTRDYYKQKMLGLMWNSNALFSAMNEFIDTAKWPSIKDLTDRFNAILIRFPVEKRLEDKKIDMNASMEMAIISVMWMHYRGLANTDNFGIMRSKFNEMFPGCEFEPRLLEARYPREMVDSKVSESLERQGCN